MSNAKLSNLQKLRLAKQHWPLKRDDDSFAFDIWGIMKCLGLSRFADFGSDLHPRLFNEIDGALNKISDQRANLGAVSNRIDHTISNLGNVLINTEASQSRIQDAEFAKVTGDLTKSQIMSQAATAMLAQANASKQGVLSLLQG